MRRKVKGQMNRMIAIVVTTLLLAGGCKSSSTSDLVTQYNRGDEPSLVQALEGGDYALYSLFDNYPIVTYTLAPGQQVGFAKGERGRVVAVAGDNKVAVEDKPYEWRYRKPKK